MLIMAVNSPTKISFSISNEVKINGNEYVYGTTYGGNENPPNYGKTMGTRGYYKNKYYYITAKITINKGTIMKDATTPSPKHKGLSIDESIGAVAGHEVIHAADPKEVDSDIRYESTHIDKKTGKPKQRAKPRK